MLPSASASCLFRGPGGTVLVPLVTRRLRALDTARTQRKVTVELCLPDAARLGRATALSTTHNGERPVKLERKGRRILLTIPKHAVATLVCLERGS